MNSRAVVLSRLRSQKRASAQLPDGRFGTQCIDIAKQFVENTKIVGGDCIKVTDSGALGTAVREFKHYKTATKVFSQIPAITGNVDLDALTNPRELADIDLAILPGRFAVGENAAVWLDLGCLGPHRAIFVIAQHLALVVGSDHIVATMHDAYEQANLTKHDFGVFVSGPSKTADIEQSLVVGAHGPRTCSVFLVG